MPDTVQLLHQRDIAAENDPGPRCTLWLAVYQTLYSGGDRGQSNPSVHLCCKTLCLQDKTRNKQSESQSACHQRAYIGQRSQGSSAVSAPRC